MPVDAHPTGFDGFGSPWLFTSADGVVRTLIRGL
jgi:hypothetical protein